MQILNDPTHPMIADAVTGVEDFYSLKEVQPVIKPRFTLCSFGA